MLDTFSRLLTDDEGATLVEYSLVLALISVVAIGIMSTIGTNIVGIFRTANNGITTANSTAASNSAQTQ